MNQQLILSGGIFSNLEAWETTSKDGLANKLARDEGRDVWEIEMTGGSIEENSSALDYTYQNLVEDYWSVLLGAVQYYTGKITVDYVGHSNGCRVALSSLKNYQTTGKSNVAIVQNLMTGNNVNVNLQGAGGAHVVNTFVGMACPGELNEITFLSHASRASIIIPSIKAGNAAMALIGDSHIKMSAYTNRLFLVGILDPSSVFPDVVILASLFSTDDKISRNLMDFYNDLSIEENSNFSLNGLNVSKMRLYYGELPLTDHDSVVPTEDKDVILNQKNGQDWSGEIKTGPQYNHVFIKSRDYIKEKILEDLR